tara:strand:- start:96673 stop:97743 length:1071 start_codon:yes stop_codon:yes gene_type:complete
MLYSKSIHSATLTITAFALIALNACVKKDPDQSGSVANYLQNPSGALLEPQQMKLCVRPTHRLGVKKCVRNGKWVRMSLAANDVDNDRTDVFSSPRISLKKENFYQDTFKFLDGVNHVANYPDYYHAYANYGGFAHFVFAMPNQSDLAVTYGFAGRDEVSENLHRQLSMMYPNIRERVKIQHWNDGGTYKKFASIYFDVIGDYTETNYRYDCAWGEQHQSYDFTQVKTKEGIDVPKIPETYVWRKIAESCDQLPQKSFDGRYTYLPFKDVSSNPISTQHQFTLQNRDKIKIYNMKSTLPDESKARIDTINPMSQSEMKSDGTTTLFLNSKKEEISRWESIYDEDLKDGSFQPETTK